MTSTTAQRTLSVTQHRTAAVQGRKVFYREAGDPASPTLVLLHGFPSSSAMFERPAKQFMAPAYVQHLWTGGARDAQNVNPDNWLLDQALLARPGTETYMLDIVEDLKTNAPLYPVWQAVLRTHQPPTLILWGNKDPLFIPPGAEGYLRDLPKAKLVWLDAGHFVLDENLPTAAAEIRGMFAR